MPENFNFNDTNINQTDIVVGSDHGEGIFRFPMKLIYVFEDSKYLNMESMSIIIIKEKLMTLVLRTES